jgi:hypothetical protein
MNIYYNNIFDKILNSLKYNENILLYIENYFNPLDNFSHIIKKKNINIYCIITNKYIYNKLVENIKGEENENNIHILSLFDSNINDSLSGECSDKSIIYLNISKLNIKIDIVLIFHLYSISYLKNILKDINIIINNKTLIYIYCSLSNENEEIILYKNKIRNNIKKFIKNNIGDLLPLSETINTIQKEKYKINKISLYKKNHYILYGDNSVYKLDVTMNLSEHS